MREVYFWANLLSKQQNLFHLHTSFKLHEISANQLESLSIIITQMQLKITYLKINIIGPQPDAIVSTSQSLIDPWYLEQPPEKAIIPL